MHRVPPNDALLTRLNDVRTYFTPQYVTPVSEFNGGSYSPAILDEVVIEGRRLVATDPPERTHDALLHLSIIPAMTEEADAMIGLQTETRLGSPIGADTSVIVDQSKRLDLLLSSYVLGRSIAATVITHDPDMIGALFATYLNTDPVVAKKVSTGILERAYQLLDS